jgi:hypothetical protein
MFESLTTFIFIYLAFVTGDTEGYFVLSCLRPYPSIVARHPNNSPNYYHGMEVYLVDIWETTCNNPDVYFFLYIPALKAQSGSLASCIRKLKFHEVNKYYYCDINHVGSEISDVAELLQ